MKEILVQTEIYLRFTVDDDKAPDDLLDAAFDLMNMTTFSFDLSGETNAKLDEYYMTNWDVDSYGDVEEARNGN